MIPCFYYSYIVISLTHASRHISLFLFLCPSLLFFLSLCLYAALFHETRYEFSYDWIFHYFDYKNVDEVLIVIYTKSIVLKFSSYTFFTVTVCQICNIVQLFKHIFKSFSNLILLTKTCQFIKRKEKKHCFYSEGRRQTKLDHTMQYSPINKVIWYYQINLWRYWRRKGRKFFLEHQPLNS